MSEHPKQTMYMNINLPQTKGDRALMQLHHLLVDGDSAVTIENGWKQRVINMVEESRTREENDHEKADR